VKATYRITITRKQGLSDPEGTTSMKALVDLGFSEVTSVAFGRIITVEMDADDPDAARGRIHDMCARLLANPVMETYDIEEIS